VLISKIADALDISVSQLIGVEAKRAAVKVPKDRRVSLVDRQTGFERQLFPAFEDAPVESALHVIPPGQSSGDLPAHDNRVEQYVLMEKGRLRVVVGNASSSSRTATCCTSTGPNPHRFENAGRTACSYYLIKRRP
jgi:hypothetical protein